MEIQAKIYADTGLYIIDSTFPYDDSGDSVFSPYDIDYYGGFLYVVGDDATGSVSTVIQFDEDTLNHISTWGTGPGYVQSHKARIAADPQDSNRIYSTGYADNEIFSYDSSSVRTTIATGRSLEPDEIIDFRFSYCEGIFYKEIEFISCISILNDGSIGKLFFNLIEIKFFPGFLI